MIDTLILMGEPGAGKTALMRKIISCLGKPGVELKNNLTLDGRRLNHAYATVYPEKRAVVFGRYDGTLYDGTDRLGRNVQPVASALLGAMAGMETLDDYIVLIEGDRLTTPTFIEAAEMCSRHLYLVRLVVAPATGERRRAARVEEDKRWLKTANPNVAGKPRREGRDLGQDATWLQGRITKLDNIEKRWRVTRFLNDTLDQQGDAFNYIWHRIKTSEFDAPSAVKTPAAADGIE